MGKRLVLLILAGAIGLAAGVRPAAAPRAEAATAASLEYRVKAEFLYRFLKFIEWPEGGLPPAGEPLRIGVVGEGPILEALGEIRRKQAKDRPLAIVRIGDEDLERLQGCPVVFVSASGVDTPEEAGRLRQALSRATEAGAPILTVGETEGFTDWGGIVNFVLVKNKVRFRINVEAADRAGLRVNSNLLRVAIVERR